MNSVYDRLATARRSVCRSSQTPSRDPDRRPCQHCVEFDFSRPCKPTDSTDIESFNGKLRSEGLKAHWFLTPDDARSKMEERRKHYDMVRPHGDIGNNLPISFMKRLIGDFRS